MNYKIAIIDMGTNTFHLLLAEVKDKSQFIIIYRDHVPVKIGKGGINHGYITEEGIERALSALLGFKEVIDKHEIRSVHAFGTSALRSAANCDEVLERIKSATGIDAKIISGEVEAEYIYHGVRCALDVGQEKALMIDIGGGSVEFIIGNDHEIFWKVSLEIGAQRLLETFHKHDPIQEDELQKLGEYFEQKLDPLFEALRIHPTKVIIGVSGTFDTLSDIFCIRESIAKDEANPETPLAIEGFLSIYEDLIRKNRKERMQIPGMIEMRVDMIVVAVCLIEHIISRHTFEVIRVSSYSLKEGVIASYLKSLETSEFTGLKGGFNSAM